MPLVAIVGRPNVGKSTLFNRLTENRRAIVHDQPGVTRDRVYDSAEWNGLVFDVVDTGGFVLRETDFIEKSIREQAAIAIEESDLILFVVDVQTGITDLDEEVATVLRKADKPIVVVANKSDNTKIGWAASEFYQLGLGDVFAISSINGTGTGDLLDEVVKLLPKNDPNLIPEDAVKVAIVGRPNVGKSLLTNALLGFDRSIVNDASGTTRDSVDTLFEYKGRPVVLIDTAGLRRKSRVTENVEFYSQLRTERAIRDADVAVLMLDATQGLESQDIKVLKQGEEMSKGLLIAVNKWDLAEKSTNTARDFENGIKDRLRTLNYVPVVFISALTKQRVTKVLDMALEIADRRKKTIPTSELNELLTSMLAKHKPPMHRNRPVKINYVTQVNASPPVFAFFCNYPTGIPEAYRRFLENQLRMKYDFTGVPVSISFRKKS
ncbi:MAG: ribosome biogenesis GTPase Der [Rhodothermales bacterium]|nr:ribosome biogenesis GTPase Der [Rhodothermales bacterium]